MDPWVVLLCLVGIGLMVAAGLIRRRSLRNASLRESAHAARPGLSPAQESQGAPPSVAREDEEQAPRSDPRSGQES